MTYARSSAVTARTDRGHSRGRSPIHLRVQEDQLAPVIRQARRQIPLRQEHGGLRVLEHEGQALCRVGRVQRHVRSARLEDPQQADHHLQRSLHADADQPPGLTPERPKMRRQPIGPGVQFTVSQPLIFKHHGHRFRRPLDLLLEQLVDAPLPRIGPPRVVPRLQDLLSLLVPEHR